MTRCVADIPMCLASTGFELVPMRKVGSRSVCCGAPLLSFLGAGAVISLSRITPLLLVAACLLLAAQHSPAHPRGGRSSAALTPGALAEDARDGFAVRSRAAG